MAPSIWRSKDAQHFQVVHRSQRDPLLNDPDASQHVLKQVTRPNDGSKSTGAGTSRADLEAANPDLRRQTRANVGEAALYGIYYDDTQYDYMQHLRPIQDGFHSSRGGKDLDEVVDTILISAKTRKEKSAAQNKSFALKEETETAGSATKSGPLSLPADVLPPEEATMRKRDFAAQLDVNPAIAGLQPNMDPHLRQALEALEDDAFLTLGQKREAQAAEEQSLQPSGSTSRDGASNTVQASAEAQSAPSTAKAPASAAQEDDLDVDDFFAQVLEGGEVDEQDFGQEDDPNAEDWRALPPGGDEHMWAPHTWTAEASRLAAIKEIAAQNAAKFNAPRGGGEGEGDVDGDNASRAAPPRASSRVARSRFSTGTATSSIFSASSKRKPGQRARLAASVAPSLNDGRTEWSMTSSSMRRNQGLSTLDDQFEALQRKYEQEEGFNEEDEDEEFEDDEDGDDDGERSKSGRSGTHADVAAHHEALFDKFLGSNEIVGRRMVEALGPSGINSSASERLGAWREGLGPLEERYLLDALEKKEGDDLPAEMDPTFPWRRAPKNSQQTWDVETILSTHTNTTNHPRLIRARDAASVAGTATTAHRGPSIITDEGKKRTARYGSATSQSSEASSEAARGDGQEDDGSDYESDSTEVPNHVTITRDRNESAEDKKARKSAAKEAKQARRQQKSARKAAFAAEHKRQVHITSARTAGGAAADVGRNGMALSGGRATLTL
ncbi:hypothetical protein V8E36_007115 [Tilletia maclaganii]